MYPTAPYNGKPAPIHAGDIDAVDFSTVMLTSSGYAALTGGQAAAAAKPSAGPPATGLGSQLLAGAALVALLVYLDKRIAR